MHLIAGMAESDTKLDPSAEAAASAEPRLAKDETEKVTTGVTEGKKDDAGEKEGVAAKAAGAGAAVKDSVFSMFGGGPKREKKEEADEGKDEPSGSSKKKDEDVSLSRVPCKPGFADVV